ncbi:hypothetical protein D3OALGB2SA_5043 [Olavius algarvensis associated proteobacterium Delta 3]|nr:hypothetical protein D3OALGB2SA_5043 [Olavius algarvensis associated proteobacterium Delta 3]
MAIRPLLSCPYVLGRDRFGCSRRADSATGEAPCALRFLSGKGKRVSLRLRAWIV